MIRMSIQVHEGPTHRTYSSVLLPAVPRVGDNLTIEGSSYVVITVFWDCDLGTVVVRVK